MIISDLVYEALQSLENVYQSTYLKDLDVTYVVFNETAEYAAFDSDGMVEGIGHDLELHILGKDEVSVHAYKDAIKEKLGAVRFDWLGNVNEFIQEIEYFHIQLNFYYLEEEEEL
ncbi:MAG: hypothetical protein CVU99_03510 [Firmicutes bacterium HGW-Firmicutes-4]|nr:MAG: hypothetical protein CVU99_03510 [Firmicutes bacterium HGW-Firmicutes-4]